MIVAWCVALFPGIAIMLMGDRLRDMLDPKPWQVWGNGVSPCLCRGAAAGTGLGMRPGR